MTEPEALDDGVTFEERADQLTDDELLVGTIVADHFDEVQEALFAKGLVLIVGPRGCGKTHMMRYASLVCRDQDDRPFAAYVSFNRYLRLEPLLGERPDAIRLFHTWVLARVLNAAQEMLQEIMGDLADDLTARFMLTQSDLAIFVDHVERGITATARDDAVVEALTISGVAAALRGAAASAGRKRTIVLMDDAALTLTPEYLVEFFEIVRVLKASDIAPKASVYPGTTEYGPRFHADHEGRQVAVWLSPMDGQYATIMAEIAQSRFPSSRTIEPDVDKALMYAAFGVPRAYLTLLRAFMSSGSGSEQAKLNKVVQDHRDARLAEYRSLALKLPTLATLVRAGDSMFGAMVNALGEANQVGSSTINQLIAVAAQDVTPLVKRMINLLVEAGLVRQESEVSHGEGRRYIRLAPHLGALIATRSFGMGSRGGGARTLVAALELPVAKHPVRRRLSKLIDHATVAGLKLDLPPCQVCNAERMTDSQRFCQQCGSKLLVASTYRRCMSLPISSVPGMSDWMREKTKEAGFATIGDLMAVQDPGTELRKIRYVGILRSTNALSRIDGFVDEFLS
ncbi:MAG: putative rane protein [Sphingomonadales bacterium]|nr:putative rane protein [Sphingomonadales bacterium]